MAGLTPAERKELMDAAKNEKVAPPKGGPRKPVELFKEGVQPPIDDDMGSAQPGQPGQPKKKMAKGGSVGSASKRADGCAQRGKTKGRMV